MPKLADRIYALLFAAAEPVSLSNLINATQSDEASVTTALRELTDAMRSGPIQLLRHNESYQLVTAPEYADDLERLIKHTQTAEMSRPALETLAVIAYRGPITRSELEKIRGVGSETMLRQLMQRSLIAEHDHANEPGRPVRYSVTPAFLRQAGLSHMSELPPLLDQTKDTTHAN